MINDCTHEFLFALAVSNLIGIRLASVLALYCIRASIPEMLNAARHPQQSPERRALDGCA
jgi:hypothetical protein